PHFGVWINGSVRLWKQSFWIRFGNGGGMTTAKEQFSTPQTGLLIEHRRHDRPGSQFNNWQRCHDVYTAERDWVTQPWGAPIIAGYTTPWNWRAESHLAALLLATQIRPANCHQEGSWPMTQFMTRYSSILWRRDIKVIPEPEKMLAVETTRPVWWKRFVYRRPVKGGEDILVHMVSIPDTENVVIIQKDNPAATTGKVMLTVPAGRKVRKVYALQPRIYRPGVDSKTGIGLDVGGAPATVVREPDPKDPAKKVWVHRTGSLCRGGPSQVELKAVVNNGKATVEVPEFVYHALIVFRLEE
ncbi:MAG: hypothetical protein L6437_16050, partial [Kiritimatiellae bacterium]|nr:hypothetical protein [Kiritimatiellia bacterium]